MWLICLCRFEVWSLVLRVCLFLVLFGALNLFGVRFCMFCASIVVACMFVWCCRLVF